MNPIVIYKSKYGAASQYAHWIGTQLNSTVIEADDVDLEKLSSYEPLIIGSSVYIGKMLIAKWLAKNAALLSGKKILLFVVCGTGKDKQEERMAYITKSVPSGIRENCQVFFLPGKMKVSALSFLDRSLLKMGARMAGKKAAEQMLRDYNDVKVEHISELFDAVKKMQKQLV